MKVVSGDQMMYEVTGRRLKELHAAEARVTELEAEIAPYRDPHNQLVDRQGYKDTIAAVAAAEAERDEARRQAETWKSGNENAMHLSEAYLDRAEADAAMKERALKDARWLRILLGRWASDYPDLVTDYDRAALAAPTKEDA